jgi:RNA polymerase sigma-70 factor, ECF subfamily
MNSKEFKQKILPLSNRIYPMAARMLADEEEAMDAVQDIMIKCWNHRSKISNHPNYKGYVFLMAKNYCLDRIRNKKVEQANQAYYKLIAETFVNNTQIEQHELSNMIERVIDKLPDQQKEIIQMRDVDGFEFDEIIAITNLKIEHIRVLLSRARKYVRFELKKIYSYEPRRN